MFAPESAARAIATDHLAQEALPAVALGPGADREAGRREAVRRRVDRLLPDRPGGRAGDERQRFDAGGRHSGDERVDVVPVRASLGRFRPCSIRSGSAACRRRRAAGAETVRGRQRLRRHPPELRRHGSRRGGREAGRERRAPSTAQVASAASPPHVAAPLPLRHGASPPGGEAAAGTPLDAGGPGRLRPRSRRARRARSGSAPTGELPPPSEETFGAGCRQETCVLLLGIALAVPWATLVAFRMVCPSRIRFLPMEPHPN